VVKENDNIQPVIGMNTDTFREMVPNLLCCEKCWGRVTRALTMPKYLERLVKSCHGAYLYGYNRKSIEVLQKALDKEREKDYKRGYDDAKGK